MKIGSHVSNSGDEMLALAASEAVMFNENCFMIYLGAPQNTYRKEIERMNVSKFKDIINENNIDINDVIIHAPYIVNLAQVNTEKRQFAIDFITKEMKLMSKIGCKYMVVHPGSHIDQGIEKGLDLISDSLKQILENTKDDDTYILIETMAGKGSECCFKFEQIAKILNNVNSSRLNVCFDTCHVHDSGYDIINNYENVLNNFNDLIGLERIKAFHINDSLNLCGSKKDRHANIGFGHIGYDALMQFVYDERFKEIPKILETPYVKCGSDSYPPYKYEIQMIKKNKFDNKLIDNIINNKGE